MTRYYRLSIFLMLFFVVGCAVDINPGGFAISVTPDSKDFGEVTIGESVQVTLSVSNNTDSTIYISELYFDGVAAADFTILSGGDTPIGVEPSIDHDIIVSFTPTAEGLLEAVLKIFYGSEDKPYEVDLKGYGVFGDGVVLVPSVRDFGNVLIGESVYKEFILSNGTDDIQRISEIEITGLNPGDYSLVVGHVTPIDVPSKTTHIIGIEFSPTEIGYRDAQLSVKCELFLDPFISTLTGNGVLASGFEITPPNYDFGDVGINAVVEADFAITNTGNSDLIISSISIVNVIDPQYSISAGALSGDYTLLPGEIYHFSISFAPTSVGVKADSFSIVHSGDVEPYIGELSGNGSDKISLSPSMHDFGSVNIGSQTTPFTFTVSNPTSTDATISDIAIDGIDAGLFNYSIIGTLPLTVPANGGSVEIDVVYSPSAEGMHSATLAITVDGQIEPLFGMLSGNASATPEFHIDPSTTPYDFGVIPFNSSKEVKFTVTNTGSGTLTLDISRQNDTEGNFTFSYGDGHVEIGESDTHVFEISFSPQSIGPKTATLRIEHNADGSPFLMTLLGEAATVNITPSSHNFGNVVIGTSTPPTQTFTITNSTGNSVTVSNVEITGTDASEFSAAPSGYIGELLPGASINIVVTCDPTKEGALSATLSVQTSVGNLSASMVATGTGAPELKVTPNTFNFSTVTLKTPGESRTQTFIAENIGTGDLNLSKIEIVGTNKDEFSIESGGDPIHLFAGDTVSIEVKFEPVHYGSRVAVLRFYHNGVAPANPYDVILRGNATGPDFILIPDVTVHSMGDTGVGKLKRKGFYIKNEGNQTLRITNISSTNTRDYTLVHANPMNIAAGEIDYFYLDFVPQATGNIGTTLTIDHNSAKAPRNITVSGNGIAAPDEIDEDFEGSAPPANWGSTGIWQWGTPSNVGPSSANSGSRCFGTNISSNYTRNQDCFLSTPVLNLSAAHSPKMSFYMYIDTFFYSLVGYQTGGWLEFSVDGGNTWSKTLSPSPAYNQSATINGGNVSVWGGYYNDPVVRNWVKVEVDLSSAAGKSAVMVAFNFHSSNYSGTRSGWYIDDVKIWDGGKSYPYNSCPQDNDITTKVSGSNYTLKWDCEGASTYDVYFGQTNPPTSKVATAITPKQYAVSVATGRKYFWQVVANTSGGSFKSMVFYFETVSTHPTLLINELDTGSVDWIEFYNPGSTVLYIGGYACTIYSGTNSSPDGTFVIPTYTILKPKQTIVFHDSMAASTYSNRVDFDFDWSNSAQGIEVILQKHEYYPSRGVDYMKVNTLLSHKPSDLSWSGTATSNQTSWYNWYRNSSTDTDSSTNWSVRRYTADKDAPNPGQ